MEDTPRIKKLNVTYQIIDGKFDPTIGIVKLYYHALELDRGTLTRLMEKDHPIDYREYHHIPVFSTKKTYSELKEHGGDIIHPKQPGFRFDTPHHYQRYLFPDAIKDLSPVIERLVLERSSNLDFFKKDVTIKEVMRVLDNRIPDWY